MRELQEVIEALAGRLGRAVAIDDPSIRLLAHTAHDEKVDEHRVHSIMTLRAGEEISDYVFGLGIRTATHPVRIPAREDLRMLARVCFPVRCQGLLLGYLWLIDDDDSLTEDDLAAAEAAADAAGQALYRARLLDDLHRTKEQQLLFDLVAVERPGDAAVTQADLDAVGLTGQLGCRIVVVDTGHDEGLLTTEAGDLSIESVLRRNLRKVKHVRSLVATRRGGRGIALVAYRTYDDPLDQIRALGTAVHDELRANLPDTSDVLVAVGPAVPTVLEARTSHQRALGVIDICRTVRDFAPVAAWEDVGIYRLLQQLPLDELADVAIPPGLQNLLAEEADHWLVDTLDTYLDAAGNVQESARRLHIHRATLYYRLSRIEELTGMSLADGQHRLALHLGVKIGRLTGAIKVLDGPDT